MNLKKRERERTERDDEGNRLAGLKLFSGRVRGNCEPRGGRDGSHLWPLAINWPRCVISS